MSHRKQKPAGDNDGLQRDGIEAIKNNLYSDNTTDCLNRQASIYPPGWLIARLRQPMPANPITRRQGSYLLNFIRGEGLESYRALKVRLGISVDTPIYRLTKVEAWLMIHELESEAGE